MKSVARQIVTSQPRPEPVLAVCRSADVKPLFDAPFIHLPRLYEHSPGETSGARKKWAERRWHAIRKGDRQLAKCNGDSGDMEVHRQAAWHDGKTAGELVGSPPEIPAPLNKPAGWDQADDRTKLRHDAIERAKRWWRGLQLEFPRKTDQQRHVVFVERHGLDLIAAGVRQFSVRTIYRRFTENGMHSDGRRQRGGHTGLPGTEEFRSDFRKVWLGVYRAADRMVKNAWRITSGLALERGEQPPDYGVVARWANREWPEAKRAYCQAGGERAWLRTHTESVRRDYSIYRPNQVWSGDWHRADFIVLHNDKPLRPWFNVWLDFYAFFPASWALSVRADSDALIASYGDGILRHGAPLDLVIDNGKDYRKRGFTRPLGGAEVARVKSVCEETGTTPHFCWSFNPGSKPAESWFKLFCDRLARLLPSYCGNRPEARPVDLYADMKAKRIEVPTLAEAAAVIDEYMETVAKKSPHSRHGGRTSEEAYTQDDPIAKRTAPEHIVKFKTMARTVVKVGRGGTVMLDGVKYGQGSVKSSAALFDRQGKQVELRYDNDRSRVLVCELGGKFLIEAFDERLRGVTGEDLKELRSRQKAARKHVRDAFPEAKTARQDLTVQAMVRAQARFHAEETKHRKAAGAESMRPLQLLPGAGELLDALPMPRSGGMGGKDAVHPLDAAPLPAGREIRFVNPIDAAPEPEWPVTDDVPSRRMELPDDWENPLDRLPDLPASDPDDDPAVA